MGARYQADARGKPINVSEVNPKTLCATIHYAVVGKTLCGRNVGRFGHWFWPLAWEPADRLGPVTCPRCIAAHDNKEHTQCAHV